MDTNIIRLKRYLKTHPGKKVPDISKELNIPEDEVKKLMVTLSSESKLLDFAKIWNDVNNYPANYDLMRAIGVKSVSALQGRARRYREYCEEHKALELPLLVWRKVVTGGIIPVPQEVLRQLEEFRFDMKRIKKDTKGIIVTSHQLGAHTNYWFWKSLKQYEKARELPLIVMPIQYGAAKFKDGILTSSYPDELKGHMIFDNTLLCNGRLMLNTMRLRPTLDRFLTDKICAAGNNVTQIFAAPKLELEHRPRIGRNYPKAIMTTGSVSHPNYAVDNLGQQTRTGELATADHCFSAIVIEFDGGLFHFRQLHANKRGEFYDINPSKGGADLFTPNGIKHMPDGVDTVHTGDWHTGKTDKKVKAGTFSNKNSMSNLLKPNNFVVQDFVDCDSVSKWEEKQAARRAFKAPRQWDSLEHELNAAVHEGKWIKKNAAGATVYNIASNHPEYVQDYIENLKWAKDNRNLKIGNILFGMMLEDMEKRAPMEKVDTRPIDPVTLWLRKYCPEMINLERQDTLLLPKGSKHQVLCSVHGDMGVRGKETRGTKEFEKLNSRVFLGHNHSAVILGRIWRVGTSTPRMQHYVRNPVTDWTNTHGIIFKNGQRQLVSFINGNWYAKWWDKKKPVKTVSSK